MYDILIKLYHELLAVAFLKEDGTQSMITLIGLVIKLAGYGYRNQGKCA